MKNAASSAADDGAYRRLVDAVVDVAIYRLDRTGLVESWNPGARRLKGYEESEILGRHFSCFYTEEDQAAGLPDRALAIAARDGAFENQGWRVRKDGSRFRAAVVIDPIRDEDGAVVGFAKVTRDISKDYERERLAASAREAEAEALAKSRFLANMSHEIRSPMNAVLGMLQILLQSGLSPDQTDHAARALSASETLMRLLDDLLDFSRIEARKLVLEQAPFRLDALMDELAAITAPAAGEKGLALDFFAEPDVRGEVVGDGARLRQVLLNLIGNAIKFTSEGTVRVSLRRPPGERRRSIVQFSVEDSGIGISADKLAVIFEDFRQGDSSNTRRFGGTGLGLAISRKLIALMGGRLDVDSKPGIGSRFSATLSLPPTWQAGGSGAPFAVPPKAPGGKPLAGLKLLAVDDTPLNREVTRHLLSAAGAEVALAGGGAAAIDLAVAADPPFDAILMDLQMPGMDGLETARRLREFPRLAAIPIIAVTANALPSDRDACLAAGMDDHVAKPFNIADLIPVILSHRRSPRTPSRLIDAEAALPRLADDVPLFVTLARQFLRDSGPVLDELAGAVGRREPAAGAALLHKFKSQAGMVGAQRLAGMAAGLEAELRTGMPDIDLAAFGALVTETCRELERVADALTPPAPTGAPAPVAASLADLDALLESGNMRALDLCAAICESRRGIAGDPFAAVAAAVDRLDFPAARAVLKTMA